jgi:hypothetical protein
MIQYNIGGRPISDRKYFLGIAGIILLFIGLVLVAFL